MCHWFPLMSVRLFVYLKSSPLSNWLPWGSMLRHQVGNALKELWLILITFEQDFRWITSQVCRSLLDCSNIPFIHLIKVFYMCYSGAVRCYRIMCFSGCPDEGTKCALFCYQTRDSLFWKFRFCYNLDGRFLVSFCCSLSSTWGNMGSWSFLCMVPDRCIRWFRSHINTFFWVKRQ